MTKFLMAAIAALFALLGTVTVAQADTAVALATTGSNQPQQPSAAQVLQNSKWLIIIYQFPGAGKSLRGQTTFQMMEGELVAVVIDRGTSSLMSVEVGNDGTITLTSRTSGSKIFLHPKPSHDGYTGKSVASNGKEWEVDMSKS